MVLKALFKDSDNELTLHKAVDVVVEMEDTAKVTKEIVHYSKAGATPTPILKLNQKKASPGQKGIKNSPCPFLKGACLQCDKINHFVKDCRFINCTSQFCLRKGHMEVVCLQKKKGSKESVSYIIKEEQIQIFNNIPGQDPVTQQLQLNGKLFIK